MMNHNDQSNTRGGDGEFDQKISTGRRRFLQAAGIGGTGLTGFGGLAAGQSDGTANTISLEAVTIATGGNARGRSEYVWDDGTGGVATGPPTAVCDVVGGNHVWMGVAPDSIADVVNPTIALTPGKTYTIEWTNTDGETHNVVIADADGNELESSADVSNEGETQSFTFEATDEMAEYYCGTHSASQRGDIEIEAIDPPEGPPSVTPGEIGIGAEPSSDATWLWNGEDATLERWVSAGGGAAQWEEYEDYFEVVYGTGDIETQAEFGDCHLHLEFRAPDDVAGDGQSRANSGIFLMDRYEFQVLDNYENPTYADGMAGAYYAQAPPLVNPFRPPGEWQAYDIFWHTPRFDDEGNLARPAQATVLINGVTVLAHLNLEGPNTAGSIGEYEAHPPVGPLRLQDHNDLSPPEFRNIWYRPLKADPVEDGDVDPPEYDTTMGSGPIEAVTPTGPATEGSPPSDAEVLLGGDSLDGWEAVGGGSPGWTVGDGYVEVAPGEGDIQTTDSFGDSQVHLEWKVPEDVEGSGLDRGNSGLLLLGQYQIQILDDDGNPVDPVQWAGSYPDQAAPQVSPIMGPGEWQTLDVIWQGPRFDGDSIEQPAQVTVLLNETVVQSRLVPNGPNPDGTVGEYQSHALDGPIRLEDGGDPVQFRNLWQRSLDPADADTGELLTVPYGMDCGGSHTGQTATIDGLEFDPSPEESQAIDIAGENRPLTAAEIWWPDSITPDPNPNAYTPGTPDIANTDHDVLYQTEHWAEGELDYTFAIENGTYDVTLHFAEISQTSEGARVFDVAVQGETVLDDLDVYAETGDQNTAMTHTVEGVEVTDEELTIESTATANNPKFSAIEIRQGGALLSTPYGMDCGGSYTDETVEIGGLTFDPSPEESQAIDITGNRTLTEDEQWWPDAVSATPNPNANTVDGTPDIAGTDHDTMYRTEHWAEDELSYEFAVSNGRYDVTIHLAELVYDSAETRVFSVLVQDEPIVEDLDLAADIGFQTAHTVTVEDVEVTDGTLTVTGVSSIENPKFSGIEIREAVDDPDVPEGDIAYEYYEGDFGTFPDFAAHDPIDTGTTEFVTPALRQRSTGYGLVFEREIPVGNGFDPGEYTFTLTADPAARLLVDGSVVIDATDGASETTGTIELTEGTRTLRLEYADQSGGHSLALGWEDPYGALLPRIAESDPLRTGQSFDWEMAVGAGEPETKRMSMPDSAVRSLSVGLYPNTNYCFDTTTATVRYGWRGGFLDPGPMISYGSGRGNGEGNLLGTQFETAGVDWPLRVGDVDTEPTFEFQGYTESPSPPTLRYSVDGHAVTHTIEPVEGAVGLAHTIQFDDPPEEPMYYVTEAGAAVERSATTGAWTDGVLEVPAGESTLEFTISPTGGDLE